MAPCNDQNELREIILLLNAEQKPLHSDEIARKLNLDSIHLLKMLWSPSDKKYFKIIVNKNQKNGICQPSYRLNVESAE
ncbi:hypothetical protein OYT88_11720 [Sporolactobacillus sp. CQH2019]|uniref:hypothetical protein n=1 Tax=Sporolactobacillus sp. CQH2019 TaxID=3023512 RepID=UPI0023674209|nr:hypothetical protein [Sporolactobacillus sp. CQH2019]MDD9149221.1 hypothetical protein [Sporolactobacillus sp. CQH2019]